MNWRRWHKGIRVALAVAISAVLLAVVPHPVMSAPIYEYSLAIASGTYLLMGDSSATIPITVTNSVNSTNDN